MDKNVKEALETATAPDTAKQPVKYRRKKMSGKKKIWLVVLLVLLAAAAVLLWRLFGKEEARIALTGVTEYGALNKAIEGSGTTAPQDSETYSLPSMNAAVKGWYVSAGDTVEVGDLLFEQDDSSLDEELSVLRNGTGDTGGILDYENEIADQQTIIRETETELAELYAGRAKLNVAAPVSGHIISVSALTQGDDVRAGETLFTVADDSHMTLMQYFSYADQDAIYLGMPAQVSVPAQMLQLDGTVTDIQYVERPNGQGMRCFAVTATVSNPGALTSETQASLSLTGENGTIYPADFPTDANQLAYADTVQVEAVVAGELLDAKAVLYAPVTAGEVLYHIDSSDLETQIESLEERIATAQKQISKYELRIEALEEQIADLEETREQYARRSEIAGKVISSEYSQMRGGFYMGSLTIYNMDTMTISVTFDELDADRLYQGMPVQVYRMSADERVYYEGVLSYLSLEATSTSGGVSTFAGTITVESGGELASGVTVYYSIEAGDSTEGVLAPIAALKTAEDGSYYMVVKADTAPENAITVADGDFPAGYWPVSVEVGQSNGAFIYVTSGVEAETEVFLRYQNNQPAGGDTTSQFGADDTDAGTFDGTGMPSGFPEGGFDGMGGGFGGGGMGGGNFGGGNRGGNGG